MIIGIDASSIPYGVGVSNYTLNLIRNLVKIDKVNKYKIFFSSARQKIPHEITELADKDRVKIYQYKIPPKAWELFWNKLHIFPIELLIGKCDVFHTWDWLQPPRIKAKMITTIHDLVPFLYPETQHKITIKTFKEKMYWAQKEVDGFICVSENSKRDLIKLFPGIATQKMAVIYEAAEDKYSRYLGLSAVKKEQMRKSLERQYGLSKYVLAQGTREPRKNLERLIEAFNRYKKRNPGSRVELAIAGKYGWGDDVDHLSTPWIRVLGFIPEKDMVALHANALCLAYPSLYEGFGLPIVKSMKVGVPVISSHSSCLPEVAGKAAILVDPLSVDEIEKALGRILGSYRLRKSLKDRGIEQAKKFSWLKVAQDTLKFYQQINDHRN